MGQHLKVQLQNHLHSFYFWKVQNWFPIFSKYNEIKYSILRLVSIVKYLYFL